MKLEIPTARVFRPLLNPARFKGAWGGRGSGKSHFFADLLVEECVSIPATRAVCVREVQKTLAQSSKQVIEKKIEQLGVGALFDVQRDQIKTPGGGVVLFQGMQDHNAESIKSLEDCRIAWVEEAQTLSERSLSLLRPTIRASGSQIWFSWNPTRKSDAVDRFLRQMPVDGAVVVRANWRDNPWFPAELEAERQLELKLYPERYDHTWEGGYAQAFEGAYFASLLTAAKREGRIGHVSADPLLQVRAFVDIGGSGARADAMAIWLVQFVQERILVLDYLEGVGQPLAYYASLLRERGWEKARVFLPHDGINANNVTGKRYFEHWREAGFDTPVPDKNHGEGAASQRIEAVRRLFPKMWFNEAKTEAGRQALGFYHEKRDSQRNVGLGPEHDWSSHAADAFGLMALHYEPPQPALKPWQPRGVGWMAG